MFSFDTQVYVPLPPSLGMESAHAACTTSNPANSFRWRQTWITPWKRAQPGWTSLPSWPLWWLLLLYSYLQYNACTQNLIIAFRFKLMYLLLTEYCSFYVNTTVSFKFCWWNCHQFLLTNRYAHTPTQVAWMLLLVSGCVLMCTIRRARLVDNPTGFKNPTKRAFHNPVFGQDNLPKKTSQPRPSISAPADFKHMASGKATGNATQCIRVSVLASIYSKVLIVSGQYPCANLSIEASCIHIVTHIKTYQNIEFAMCICIDCRNILQVFTLLPNTFHVVIL